MSGEEKIVLHEVLLRNISANTQKILSLQLEDRLKRALKFLNFRNIRIGTVAVSGGGFTLSLIILNLSFKNDFY